MPPRDEPALARRRRAALAGHRGELDVARGLLHDADPDVRATALAALARAAALTAEDLTGAAADGDPAVRRRAAAVVGSVPARDAGIRISLLPLLADPDPTVVEVAAWACGELDPSEPGTVDALVRLAMGHDDALVREAAVAALGALGDPSGLPAILAGTADKPAVRRRAVLALAPFEGAEVDAAIARAREDRDWQVRQAAEDLS